MSADRFARDLAAMAMAEAAELRDRLREAEKLVARCEVFQFGDLMVVGTHARRADGTPAGWTVEDDESGRTLGPVRTRDEAMGFARAMACPPQRPQDGPF